MKSRVFLILRENRHVDSDDLAPEIHQRASGIALVDRGISLNEVLVGAEIQPVTSQGRDNALGHRVAETIRVTNSKHNIPDTDTLVAEVCAELSTSPLKGRRILVTGGPTPVPVDNVRLITNRFTGKLGTAIADELTRKVFGWDRIPATPAEFSDGRIFLFVSLLTQKLWFHQHQQ